MKLTRVGVDLAKNVFQLHGVDRAERPVWCKRLKRNRWIKEIEQNVEPGVEIGLGLAIATGPLPCLWGRIPFVHRFDGGVLKRLGDSHSELHHFIDRGLW